jgi:hypothetical protein
MSETETQKFEQWAIVEVMGHRRFAGMVSEQTIGGSSFVRVDVPAVTKGEETLAAFTKLFGSGSIYCISPVSEEIARGLAARWQEAPISVYELPERKIPALEDQTEAWHDPEGWADEDD